MDAKTTTRAARAACRTLVAAYFHADANAGDPEHRRLAAAFVLAYQALDEKMLDAIARRELRLAANERAAEWRKDGGRRRGPSAAECLDRTLRRLFGDPLRRDRDERRRPRGARARARGGRAARAGGRR